MIKSIMSFFAVCILVGCGGNNFPVETQEKSALPTPKIGITLSGQTLPTDPRIRINLTSGDTNTWEVKEVELELRYWSNAVAKDLTGTNFCLREVGSAAPCGARGTTEKLKFVAPFGKYVVPVSNIYPQGWYLGFKQTVTYEVCIDAPVFLDHNDFLEVQVVSVTYAETITKMMDRVRVDYVGLADSRATFFF